MYFNSEECVRRNHTRDIGFAVSQVRATWIRRVPATRMASTP